jgi:hypothetical protein
MTAQQMFLEDLDLALTIFNGMPEEDRIRIAAGQLKEFPRLHEAYLAVRFGWALEAVIQGVTIHEA